MNPEQFRTQNAPARRPLNGAAYALVFCVGEWQPYGEFRRAHGRRAEIWSGSSLHHGKASAPVIAAAGMAERLMLKLSIMCNRTRIPEGKI